MATSQPPHTRLLKELAGLMLSIAGESVTMVKRSAPDPAMKLRPKDEWRIYLEFLKILFNFADRTSALHLPVRDQPQFMDGLEDAVAEQLKDAMAPMLGSETDPMEFTVTIGNTVAESRELYERFKFVITEDGKEKDACLAAFGERVADAMKASGNGMVASAAVLCVTAAVPALSQMLESLTRDEGAAPAGAGATTGERDPSAPIGNEIKLISVMSSIQGEEVETRWGLHPQFRKDLSPQQSKQLTKLMNRVAQLLGQRYASNAFSEKWASWHTAGHA